MTMDKLGFSLRKLGTLMVFSFITFSLLLIFSVKHQNSIFDFVAGFSNHDVTSSSTVLKQGASNVTVKAESLVGIGRQRSECCIRDLSRTSSYTNNLRYWSKKSFT